MSQVIAVYNFKGGVGKTSTTLSLAHSWSRAYKVLVIDCDPQANLTQAFDKDDPSSSLFTISKKLLHDQQPDIAPIEIHSYLHLIPGDYRMAELESNSQFISFSHIIFYKLFAAIKHKYDFILLDFPTHFGVTVKSFLINANNILIPSTPGSFSIAGFKTLINQLSKIETEKALTILGVFFNQYRSNTLFHQKIIRQAEEELGSLILDTRVRESIKVSEAHEKHASLYSFTDQSAVAEDFLNLSDEVIARMNTKSIGVVMTEISSQKAAV